MHAPPTLLLISALIGIAIPLSVGALMSPIVDNVTTLSILKIVSLAVGPLLIARIAYRQGYDRASAGA